MRRPDCTQRLHLARKIIFEWMKLRIDDPFPETEQTVGQSCLALHRSYAAALRPVLGEVHAIAHITGGGISGESGRVLPAGADAIVDAGSWPWPPLFRVLMRAGQVSRDEMRRRLNLGVG